VSSSLSPRRDARRNHERLLAEAKQLFAERGIDAPLDELAVRAGVGAGTVYRHFPNRDALVRELYDAAVTDLREFAPQFLAAETGWKAIELWLDLVSGWLVASPHLPAVMRRVAELDPTHRPGTEFAPMMDAVVSRAKAEGTLRQDVTAVDLSIMVDMLGSLGQYGGAYLPYWRRQLAVMLDGLRARPDLTPLPGEGQAFDEFHDMSHAKGPSPAPR
jgi:AcrR family transcriptional regulator